MWVPALAAPVTWSALVNLFAATEPFWHQAVLILGGTIISAAAVIGAAVITSRHVERHVEERVEQPVQELHEQLHDVKQKLGADRRATDEPRHSS